MASDSLKMMVYASLFSALIAMGAFIAIPIGPVPIVLQNLFVYIAALFLGSRWALACVGVYLLAGALGLPVFAGGTGGLHRFLGPTGGYLVGYLPAAYVIGLVAEKAPRRKSLHVAALIIGTLVIYFFGVSWLKLTTGMAFAKAMAIGCFPFLIGDAVKIAAAVPLHQMIRKMALHP